MEEIIVQAIGEGVVTKRNTGKCFNSCGNCYGVGGSLQYNVAMSEYSYY